MFPTEVSNVMPVRMANAIKCAEVSSTGSRLCVTMLRMVDKCTVRHVAVVVVKITVGCTKESMFVVHALVILRVSVLSRIHVRSVMTQHAMVVIVLIWSLSRMVWVVAAMALFWRWL